MIKSSHAKEGFQKLLSVFLFTQAFWAMLGYVESDRVLWGSAKGRAFGNHAGGFFVKRGSYVRNTWGQ
jgi:hypothetical protein